MDLLPWLVPALLGPIGIYKLSKDARAAWAKRRARDLVSRLEIIRVASFGLAVVGLLLILPMVALKTLIGVYIGMALIGVGIVLFLVLSFAVGLLEGYRGRQ